MLLSKGADPNKAAKEFFKFLGAGIVQERSRTPLYFAVKRGDTKLVRSLLERGADLNKGESYTNKDGRGSVRPPLYAATLASSNVSTEIVRGLLERGADPNKGMRSTDEDGDVTVSTPLYAAAEQGRTEVVRSLLESKADPNEGERITFKDGDVTVKTPLYQAAWWGYPEVVKILLASGARQDLDTGGGELG